MESKDMFVLLLVAGVAILLYAYWHFVGSKKEVKRDEKGDEKKEETAQEASNEPVCQADFCPIGSY